MPVTPSDRPLSEVRHRARLTCVPRTMRSVAPALAATLLLAACTAAHGTVTKPAAPAPRPQLDSYVALGDSFTAAPYVPSTSLADGLKAWQDQSTKYGNEQGFTVK